MPPVNRFEELIAWQVARQLTNRVFDVSEVGKFARVFSIRDQMQRAAVSVMANIAEGFDRRSPRDFARFLMIAKSSAAEVRSLLHLATDRHLVTAAEYDELFKLVCRTGALIAKLRASILSHIDTRS